MTMITAFTATRAGLHAPGYDRGADWRESAACREIPVTSDWDPWYPDTELRDFTQARAICDTCPVAQQCLDTALDEERGLARSSRHGMRGGKTAAERWAADTTTSWERTPGALHREILRLRRCGQTLQQIADDVGVTRRSVERHLARDAKRVTS